MKRSYTIAGVFAAVAVIAAASYFFFNPDDSISPEALKKQCVLISSVSDVQSTAGHRQAGILKTLETIPSGLASLKVTYPFDGAVFPPEFIPPMFMWLDETGQADRWMIDIALPGETGSIRILTADNPLPDPDIDMQCIEITAKDNPPYPPYQPPATNWTPTDEVWRSIVAHAKNGLAKVTIYGVSSADPKRILSAGTVSIGVSPDPVGAPIFYRDVPMIGVKRNIEDEIAGVIQPLPALAQDIIKWRLRDVSKRESRVVLHDIPTCANCHSFSADGSTLGMDIDGPAGDKGAYAIAKISPEMVIQKDNIISWNYSYKEKFKYRSKTIGFLSQISPDGSYAVTTLNEQVFVSNFRDHKFIQVFYPTRGLLAYYSTAEDDIHLLPGADDPSFVHCDAVWSPDGSYLVFAGAKACDANIEGRPRPLYANDPNETPIQYDLYRIPFNGGKGGTKEIVPGASNNGMSNTFPKISPDGKWIVFVKCANGQLMRPDSKLWIVPAEGGEAREMNCNLDVMNSWHSFSPNGRWLVFSSKGMGPYTRMYLTHIDENGDSTPPVLIPDCTAANRSVNIPEFVNIAYDDLKQIEVPAVDFYRHHRAALAYGNQGNFTEALKELNLALAEEPDDKKIAWELHHRAGLVLQKIGDLNGAIDQWQKAIAIDPNVSSEPYFLIAIVDANQKKFAEADNFLKKTLDLAPKHSQALYYRAKLRIDKNATDVYNPKAAIPFALKANELTMNREPAMLELLGWTYAANGRMNDAVSAMEKALEYAKPRGIEEHTRRIEEKIALYKAGKV